MTPPELAAVMDHTLLKAEATLAQIERLCRQATEYRFASVCVNPVYVSVAARVLEGTGVKVCTVAGFPLGAVSTAAKVFEAREAMRLGAAEIDMVLWIGGLKADRHDWVKDDIAQVAHACSSEGALLKVILECALLSDDEKRLACELCVEAGAQFVKTSTGFGPGGATEEDVRLMAAIAGPAGLGVKAAGGIRTLADAQRMVAAGATRLGTSASVTIIEEARAAG